MTNGERIITIPRANPINAFTMAVYGRKLNPILIQATPIREWLEEKVE